MASAPAFARRETLKLVAGVCPRAPYDSLSHPAVYATAATAQLTSARFAHANLWFSRCSATMSIDGRPSEGCCVEGATRRQEVRITIEIDDEEIRRVFGPVMQPADPTQTQPSTRLLTVKEVADQLGVSRSKAYHLVLSGAIQSLAIGRSRRVSPGAVAEFIARPSADSPDSYSPPRYERERSPSFRKPTPAALTKPEQPSRRRRKALYEIDLSPKPMESRDRWMTDEEWEKSLSGLVGNGWLPDIVDQMNADRRDGLRRAHVLGINDAARYLGLTRYGVEKLIKTGKLRLFTIAPIYRDEKPQQCIPAMDILALR